MCHPTISGRVGLDSGKEDLAGNGEERRHLAAKTSDLAAVYSSFFASTSLDVRHRPMTELPE
ncbi:hypothetical protein TorRG33x02_163900 [Trema orientale]|uniref:Uncharacterized protein n=1 Tax=Trema orientale TaxID=63057 RepID=A0A2P5EQT5_TREOI|nr:hypothetical protein TorRG33x02_163900 [Trema orientale]